MSTRGQESRRWSRRRVVGATVVALVVVSLLTVGAASGRPFAQHRSGDASAALNDMSYTHLLSRAQGRASSVSRRARLAAHHSLSNSINALFPAFAPVSTGCGTGGTIADQSGFEDADANL